MRASGSRLLRSAAAFATGLGLVAAGATSATAAPTTTAPPPLSWAACADAPAFECSTMPAPLDYGDPGGPQIDVAVIRHPATDPAHRIGSLYWNPGGPGGAGTTSLPAFYPAFPERLRERYDIVSFDPRGIGRTAQLQCFDTPQEEAAVLSALPAGGFPVTPQEERTTVEVNARFDAACAQHGGPVQEHMGTADVARDMDRLRATIGDAKLDYYGISYGTYLGATYANLFPQQVGRLVLDGNVDPRAWNDARGGRTTNTFSRIRSPLGSETGLQLMLRQCGAVSVDRCAFSAGSGPATVAKYRALLAQVSKTPATVGGTPYGYALVVSTATSGLITQNTNPVTGSGWKDLAAVLQQVWTSSRTGVDPAPALAPAPGSGAAPAAVLGGAGVAATGLGRPALSGAFPDELTEGLPGVLCGESPNPRDPNSYGTQARRDNSTLSPDGFGYPWAWLSQPCAQWQARAADPYTGPFDRSKAPVLVIGTLADSNTAFTGSLAMASQLGNARLLTETGGGHTALLNRSTCVDDRVSDFIIDGTLPRRGTVCHQDAQPF